MAWRDALRLRNTWSNTMTPSRLLPRREVETLVGLRRSALYCRLDPRSPHYDPTFPKPVPIGGTPGKPTAVRWLSTEIDAWIASRIAARDAA